MRANFDPARLRGHTLFVGTPLYDGKCFAEFAFSVIRLTALCAKLDIALQFYFLSDEALVAKARNEIVEQFLRSDCDSLLFVDADIGFDAKDVVDVLALQQFGEGDRHYDVLAAPYPLKKIEWTKILAAAQRGLADENPDILARYASGVRVEPVSDQPFAVDQPVEVIHAGTGFMMIRRRTFERYRDHFPWRRYSRNEDGTPADGASAPFAFFESEIDNKRNNMVEEARAFAAREPDATPEQLVAYLESDASPERYSELYLSEDYAFCRRARKAGMKIWLCPWIMLNHTGNHRFESRLIDLAQLGLA